ncbi:MAG: hypothetical protein ACE5LX_05595, partial [Nitrospinota bacterium]
MRRKLRFLALCAGVFFAASLILAGPLAPTAGAAKKPLRVGFSMGLSGPLAPAGKAALLSMQIAAEDFNK